MSETSRASLRRRLLPTRFGLASQIAVWAIVIGTLTAATVSFFAYRGNVAIVVERQLRTLATSVDLAAGRIATRFDSAERDAVFLSKTPTVAGFVRALANGGVDPADGTTAAVAGDRIADVFSALLEARPGYFDALLLDASGNEIVRVNRDGSGTLSRTAPANLQDKSQRPYFIAASRLPPGAVFISDIELNQERGAIELPYRPTAHVAVPLYSGLNALVGVIVLNLELKTLFEVVNDTLGSESQHIVTNPSGDYLVAPLSEKAFGFDLGRRYRLQDDYPELAPLLQSSAATFSGEIERPAGTYLAVGQRVAFDPAHPDRFIAVAAVLSNADLLAQTRSLRDWTALVASLAILLGVAFAVFLSRLIVRPLRTLTAAATSIGAGRRDADFGATAARRDETGELARVMTLMMQEIAEREERLTAQADELTRSNQELAQFAYVASHDLQEPLRMVGSYLELLARRYEGKLDDEALEFIGFAVDGATRMKRLINDLLGYSRAGNSPLKIENANVQNLVDTVLAQLALQIGETHAEVTVGPMPMLRADPIQLARVFQNLIENALKYRSPDKPPVVRIAAASSDGIWRFTVTDNGIGIDPQFKEKIFEIFKRLHGRDRYAGTGIGLAVTKLVVERHGGRIWVDPAPGGGSVFTFTIPDKAA
ncbi:MAG TPA: ATP-binding protein [Bauldia sp.]|nr:ATP-binding protein [Bauldia sp.]